MLHGTYRCGAARWFVALRAARAALIIAGGVMVASCTTSGQPVLGSTAMGGSGPRTVAFESISGPPESLFRKLVTQLNQEATAHEISMVSRESPAQFRIRGYVAAHVQGQKTSITWVWDVFDADRVRATRLTGEVPGAPSERAWAAADDAVVTRIARDGMSSLAAFLANPGSVPPVEFSPPRNETSPNVASMPAPEGPLAFLPPPRP
jgi:hypothetical protein